MADNRDAEMDDATARLINETTWETIVSKLRLSLLLLFVFYIAMLSVGIWGLKKCPVEENIPFFLIVIGCIGLVSKIVGGIRSLASQHYDIPTQTENSLYTIEFVFMILGSYWVFKEFQPSYDPKDSNYCSKTVYMFAFSYLAISFGFVGVLLVCFFCFLGCILCIKYREQRDVEAARESHQSESPLTASNS